MMRPGLLGLLLVLAACDGPTVPRRPSLAFDAKILFGIPTLPPEATGEAGAIRIAGVVQTPNSGFQLFAVLEVPGAHALTVDIDVVQANQGFPFTTQHFYQGRISGLAPGDYDVSIYERSDYAGPRRERVLHATVTVQ